MVYTFQADNFFLVYALISIVCIIILVRDYYTTRIKSTNVSFEMILPSHIIVIKDFDNYSDELNLKYIIAAAANTILSADFCNEIVKNNKAHYEISMKKEQFIIRYLVINKKVDRDGYNKYLISAIVYDNVDNDMTATFDFTIRGK